MEFTKFKTYIEHLDSLIGKECTGTADEFAQKLGISERTLQNHLQQLRGMGINVIYDHYKRTYKYTQKGRIFFGFDAKEISKIRGAEVFKIKSLHTSKFNIINMCFTTCFFSLKCNDVALSHFIFGCNTLVLS